MARAFIFPGQGSQAVGMGKALAEAFASAREVFEEIDEAPSAILSRKSDERERTFRGPKPAGRFDSGRRRGYDDREEFRARDEFAPAFGGIGEEE